MSLVPWKLSGSAPVLHSRMADELVEFQRDMNNLMRNFFGGRDISTSAPLVLDARFHPSIDVKEKDDAYLLDADIPGVNENDLSLDFHNNILTIKGERKNEIETKDSGCVCIERSSGSFQRNISFDEAIDQEKIKAELKGGVLHVELAKKEKSKASHRKIEIKH